MKNVLLFFSILILFEQGNDKIKKIPSDLEALQVTPFYQQDEILRVWIFPEGGAAHEMMVEFFKQENGWQVLKYTYLLDEFKDIEELQTLREKKIVEDKEVLKLIPSIVNEQVLLRDIMLEQDDESMWYPSTMYRVEYKKGDKVNVVEFIFDKNKDTDTPRLKLISLVHDILMK